MLSTSSLPYILRKTWSVSLESNGGLQDGMRAPYAMCPSNDTPAVCKKKREN